MNIEQRFLQKAIEDKNYVDFTYEKTKLKKQKPLKFEDNILYTDISKYDYTKVSKLIVLKDRF